MDLICSLLQTLQHNLMPLVSRKFLWLCPTNRSIYEAVGITTTRWKQSEQPEGRKGENFLSSVIWQAWCIKKKNVLKTTAHKQYSAWRVEGKKPPQLCQKAHPLHPAGLRGLRNDSIPISYRKRQYFYFFLFLISFRQGLYSKTVLYAYSLLCPHLNLHALHCKHHYLPDKHVPSDSPASRAGSNSSEFQQNSLVSLLADHWRNYWSAVRIEKTSTCILSNMKHDEGFFYFISQKSTWTIIPLPPLPWKDLE